MPSWDKKSFNFNYIIIFQISNLTQTHPKFEQRIR